VQPNPLIGNSPTTSTPAGIDDYLRERLMPVEGAIPQLAGIEMYGNSIPAETAGGDLFEYINFQQRYNIDARIALALTHSQTYLEPLLQGASPRNEVDVHAQWLDLRHDLNSINEAEYRKAKSSEQIRIAENLQELYTIAGVLLVDAQGHGIIAAKIASTVHDTFHAAMLSELDYSGRTTSAVFETVNLRLAQSVTTRNALGRDMGSSAREVATMLYGQIHLCGVFRFVNFGHPQPLVFSAKHRRFMEIHKNCVAQFPALGLEIPEDHPDRSKYVSIDVRPTQMGPFDVEEVSLVESGDILFLYTDGVYDGSDEEQKQEIEEIIDRHKQDSAKGLCNAILEYAVGNDDHMRQSGEPDRIDDKTVFIIKRQ